MKIVYIAHPIAGDVNVNLEKIKMIARHLNLTRPDIVPFVPYWLDCHALDDNNPDERDKGIQNSIELFNRRFIDEVWCFGGRISNGMRSEIEMANKLGIPVVIKFTENKK